MKKLLLTMAAVAITLSVAATAAEAQKRTARAVRAKTVEITSTTGWGGTVFGSQMTASKSDAVMNFSHKGVGMPKEATRLRGTNGHLTFY